MGKKGIETLVGLFVLLGIAGLVFLALKAANLAVSAAADSYALTAKFDNIGGLKVRAPVRSAGVTVGPGRLDHARHQDLPGTGAHGDRQARAVPEGLVGAHPHRRPAGRPVHRSGARR